MGEIAQKSVKAGLLTGLQGNDGQFYRNSATVFAERSHLNTLIENRPDPGLMILDQTIVMLLSEIFGDDQVSELFPDSFIATPSENALGLFVPSDNQTTAVHAHYRIQCRIEEL